MSLVPLSEVCDITAGQSAPQDSDAFGPEGHPFIRAGSLEALTNGGSENDCEHLTEKKAQQYRMRLFPKDTIVFAKSGMSAKIGRVYRLKAPAYIVSHLAAVTPQEDVDPSYLQRWFERNPPSRLIPNEAYPSIRTSEIGAMKIDLPKKIEQKCIANILDKADAIRRKRQQAIQLVDEFLRSVFLDMFGDPILNDRQWHVSTLNEHLTNIDSGWSPKCLDSRAGEDEWGVLKLSAVTSGYYVEKENKALPDSETPRPAIEVKPGDLLLSRKNTYQLVAASAYVFDTRDKLMLPDTIFRLRFNTDAAVDPIYIWSLFSHRGKRAQLQKLATGAAGSMPNISKEKLKGVEIPAPPIERQLRYRAIVLSIKTSMQKLMQDQMNMPLYDSLSQRAFRGDI